MTDDEAQKMSRLMFEARELIEMFSDAVEARTGQRHDWSRQVVAQIDEYRASQGWSPDCFGGEGEPVAGRGKAEQ